MMLRMIGILQPIKLAGAIVLQGCSDIRKKENLPTLMKG